MIDKFYLVVTDGLPTRLPQIPSPNIFEILNFGGTKEASRIPNLIWATCLHEKDAIEEASKLLGAKIYVCELWRPA